MVSKEDYIVESPFPDIDLPEVDFYSYVTADFEQFGDRLALVDSVTGESYTYRRLIATIDAVAQNLYNLGLRRSSTIALYGYNCLEYVITYFAAWKLGSVPTFINSLLLEDEVHRELQRTDAKFVFCSANKLDSMQNIFSKMKIKTVISNISSHPIFTSFASLTTRKSSNTLQEVTSCPSRPGDILSIFFSSGTTGLPKAVLLTHRNVVSKVALTRHGVLHDQLYQTDYRALVVYQPISHIYGSMMVNQSLCWGATVVLMPKFDLQHYLQLNAQYKCPMLALVPPLVVLFTKNPDLLRRYDLSSVQYLHCGAAPLSLETETEILKLIPCRTQLVGQGYGMTETTAGICYTPSVSYMEKYGMPDRMHHAGVPFANHKVKVIDPVTGRSLPPGQTGEICFAGPSIMKGYLDDQEATERTITKDGWLLSGDLGYHDNRGYIYIIDRLKELIKYKGYQVAPAELEDVLLSHPGVADCGVVGVTDQEAGEVPMAWVVPKPGVKATEGDIAAYVAGKVAPYKKLRGGVRFVSEIPKSPTGKVLRRHIRQHQTTAVSKL